MQKIAFSIISVSLLAGCASTNNDKQNQETLNAIRVSESTITNEIETIKLSLSNQSDYIESLETEIMGLQTDIKKLQKTKNYTKKTNKKLTEKITLETPNQTTLPTNNTELLVLGAIENVQLDNIRTLYSARIDTGATTSSINAVDIEKFERDGKSWVKFHLNDSSIDTEKRNWIEAPIIRYANIRQPTLEAVEKRAVIELWVKIGKIHEKSQFTLANRSQMSHPILLGREFIQDIALVDVSKTFLLSTQKETHKN